MKEIPIYKTLRLFLQTYAHPGLSDQRAVEDYVECESHEGLSSLRAELIAITKGNYIQGTMDLLVGQNRIARHGSYEEWAKLVLLWIAEYRS